MRGRKKGSAAAAAGSGVLTRRRAKRRVGASLPRLPKFKVFDYPDNC
ncbi:MAG: hypothetical protein H0V76_02230 [Blastocatellia bacterium]|nr:hypothetical protein [Blastocatellia bacterium]